MIQFNDSNNNLIGKAVQWVKDPNYKGFIMGTKDGAFGMEYYVEFVSPKSFKVWLPPHKVEFASDLFQATNHQQPNKSLMDYTNLSEEELHDLKLMYIDMALATNDAEWFAELMKEDADL